LSIHRRSALVFWIVAACIVAAFLTYSQLYAYVGDEPFHLLAAQLISAGKRPYLDFFYQHPPLHAYLTAGLFRVSETWRTSHAFSALAVSLAAVLASRYARDLFVEERARFTAGVLTMIFFSANCYALIFATTGLPYGFCLLCTMAALFFSRPGGRRLQVFVAGLFAGAAAASNLLTFPVLAVVVARILMRDRRLVLVFIAGASVAFTPLLILFAQSPSQVFFNLVGYHLVDRPSLGWRFNVRQMIAWFWSVQGATLTVLAILANWFRRSRERRRPARLPAILANSFRQDEEVHWCTLTALALLALVACAKTTSSFYVLLTLPFLAILAAVGAVELAHRAGINRSVENAPEVSANRFGALVVVVVAVVYLAGLTGMKYVWRWQAPYGDHRKVEMIARELEACTSGSGNYYASEAVYFAVRRSPPPGLENRFNPRSRADELLRDGEFDAVCIGTTNPKVEEFKLLDRYASVKTVSLDGYSMYVLCDKRP
jgi:hypothetical protein